MAVNAISDSAANAIPDGFQGYLANRYPNSVVSDFRYLSGGWEADVYSFKLTFADGNARDLILRVYLGDDGVRKTLHESSGLYQLNRVGYPAPEILLHETDSAVLGKPFIIMEKLEGQSLWPVLYTLTEDREHQLLDQFGVLIAQLHRLDWHPFTEHAGRYKASPTAILDDLLATSRRLYQEFNVEGFLAVADWLEAHKPTIKVQPAVVHLDFHANNVFLHPDDRMSVIDWTQLTVSDYRCDLSWTLMLMGDHGKPHWGQRILDAYIRTAGHSVPDLDYFNVISYIKLLASTIISLRVGPEKLGLRPDSIETMKQQKQDILLNYQRVQAIAQVTIPEIERTLDQLS